MTASAHRHQSSLADAPMSWDFAVSSASRTFLGGKNPFLLGASVEVGGCHVDDVRFEAGAEGFV